MTAKHIPNQKQTPYGVCLFVVCKASEGVWQDEGPLLGRDLVVLMGVVIRGIGHGGHGACDGIEGQKPHKPYSRYKATEIQVYASFPSILLIVPYCVGLDKCPYGGTKGEEF